MISNKSLQSFIGKKFNRLTILSIELPRKRNDGRNHNVVKCLCDCGDIKNYKLTEVKSGHSKSCGCLRTDNYRKKFITHGKSHEPIYQTWAGMLQRCTNKKCSAYKNYGGRGIDVCAEWKDSKIFIQWALANGYSRGLEIDRINNNGNYEPSNCRFATKIINLRNTRRNKHHFYDGQNKTLPEWSEILGVDYALVNKRLWRGWDFTKAVETPNLSKAPNEQLVMFEKPMIAEYDFNNEITIVE